MKRKLCVLLLALALLLTACGSEAAAVFVQPVKELSQMGAIAPGDRFAGVVVSENVAKIQKDEGKTVAALLVREGQDVAQGDPLFSYDTDQLRLELDKKLLEQDQLRLSIENYAAQITELEAQRARAGASQQLAYTVQIQTTQLDLKEAELQLTAKQTEITQATAILENATVTAPVTGRVQTISEDGYDNYGNPLPYITIQQSGAYRVKGMIGELQLGALTEGTAMRILSRTDENALWQGVISQIDYESPSQGSSSDMYYGMAADEMTSASRYPFYVTLEDTQGLLLGQHVYLELAADTAAPEGVAVSSGFIAYDDNSAAYVWAENRGKLEKRPVVLGAYDPMTDCVYVTQGLGETDYIAFPDPELCREGAPTTRTQEEVLPEEVF